MLKAWPLNKSVKKSAQRLQELENLIKRSNNAKVKETLSNALNGFEGKGLQ
jgi:chemotaxis protein MotB